MVITDYSFLIAGNPFCIHAKFAYATPLQNIRVNMTNIPTIIPIILFGGCSIRLRHEKDCAALSQVGE